MIVGPSGAGKGTLISHLTKKYPGRFGFSVSYTTRPARAGETHGVNYFYVGQEEFKGKIERDEFIEHCCVHTNSYGTEKAQIAQFSANGIIPLLDIDIQGAKKVHAAFPDTNFIFICPPSVAALKERMTKRGQDSDAQIAIRVNNAVGEIAECIALRKVIQYRVVNDDLEKASERFLRVIEGLYAEELGVKH